jgi:hypothetical protein
MNPRQEINRQILKKLIEMNDSMPDQRFGQLLINCGITDETSFVTQAVPAHEVHYYEESEVTLKRVYETLERILNASDKKD